MQYCGSFFKYGLGKYEQNRELNYLEYLSCHINISSVNAAYSPWGNFSASQRKLVSMLRMWFSLSKSFCFKFSISACKCKLVCSQPQS